jgi:hypothetical protein
MVPQQRDVLNYDATSVSNASFSIPLPSTVTGTDGDGNPIYTITIQPDDWGIVLVVWSAVSGSPLAGLSTSWQVLQPPTVANQVCFAVLARQFVDGDTVVDIELTDSRFLLAVGIWYSGADRVDTVGQPGINPSAVLQTSTAPSMVASGASDELGLSLFVSAMRSVPPVVQVSQGTVVVGRTGNPNTVLGLIAAGPLSGPGPTGDVIATYDTGAQSRAGIQLGLLTLGGQIAGTASFGTQVTLAATGVPARPTDAAFAVAVALAVTGLSGSQAAFTPTVVLSAVGRPIVPINLNPVVNLSTVGQIRGFATKTMTIGLATIGSPHFTGTPAFNPRVVLAATGVKKVSGMIGLGPTVTLSTRGRALTWARPGFTVTVRLAALGTPTIPGTAHFRPGVTLFTRRNGVFILGTAGWGPLVTLRAAGVLMATSGSADFTPEITLTADGTPDFTPVGEVDFGLRVTLAADGFSLPRGPVGVTIKPVLQEPDPDWHGRPKDEYDWRVDLPVGTAGFDTEVTLIAEGGELLGATQHAAHTWSVDE